MITQSTRPGNKRTELEKMAKSVSYWWHSINLGHGVITKGYKTAETLQYEFESLRLPDLRDKTVLDIGAWDGFFSFEAEWRGARRVVALDHDVWKTWPGKSGYDTAHKALDSKVETVVDDFMTMDLEPLRTFDVVLFLGVLYHTENPLGALRRVACLTNGIAIIETHAVVVPGYEHLELCEFYSSNQLNGDVSNWWGPNLKALEGMCRAAGFARVEVEPKSGYVDAPHPKDSLCRKTRRSVGHLLREFNRGWRKRPRNLRAIVHAWK
jgi:tRNA (mo5U34)-methyltransferase